MARLLLVLLIGLAALPALAADEAPPPPKEMVLLTVSGLIGNTNRDAPDPRKDSLLAAQRPRSAKPSPSTGRAACARAGQRTAQPPEPRCAGDLQGAAAREVLGHVEAAKVKISFTAVNGYTGWLTPDDIDSSDWILALEVNGVPLGIGQQGPLWLINTRAADFKPTDTHEAHWVWAVFYMHVGDD